MVTDNSTPIDTAAGSAADSLQSDRDFWTTQHVIVTGGSGFLGRYVVEQLQALEAGSIAVPRRARYDLRTPEAVERLYDDNRDATMVIHLAANVGGIGYNRENPGALFYDNIMMGTLLLEYARQRGIAKFVGVGTICEYPKHTAVPFREEDLWSGYPEETNAPYGLAKKMGLVQSQAYRDQYGYNSIHILPTNLYGPGDNFDPTESHVIPALMRRMLHARETGGDVTLFGDGTPTREFLYVRDAARGIVQAAQHYDSSEPVNLGSGVEISIGDLAQKIARIVGFEGRIHWDTSKPNGQPRRNVDVSRARREFGFEAQVMFDEGIREEYDWYIANRQQTEAGSAQPEAVS